MKPVTRNGHNLHDLHGNVGARRMLEAERSEECFYVPARCVARAKARVDIAHIFGRERAYDSVY